MIDLGPPGTWADMLANSPCLKVTDYQPDQLPDRDSTKAPFLLPGAPVAGADGINAAVARPGSLDNFHGASDSAERQ